MLLHASKEFLGSETEMEVVVLVAVVVGGGGGVAVDDALDAAEVLDVAREGDGAGVVETVLLLGRAEQRQEQRMVQVPHRHHEPLLLLPLAPHPDRHPPPGRRRRRLAAPPPPAAASAAAGHPVQQLHVDPRHADVDFLNGIIESRERNSRK